MDPAGDFDGLLLEILLVILARLDLLTLLRIRSVCKCWYRIVASKEFIRQHDEFHPKHEENPWVLFRARSERPSKIEEVGIFSHDLHYDEYDYSNKMHTVREVWQPVKNITKPWSLPLGLQEPSSLFLGLPTSFSGLVCGRIMRDKHQLSLAVGNPLFNKWKILPPAPVSKMLRPLYHDYVLVGNSSEASYTVMVCCVYIDDKVSPVVQYDSQQGKWLQFPGFKFKKKTATDEPSCLLHADFFRLCRKTSSIACYQCSSNKWFHVSISEVVPFGVFPVKILRHQRRDLILLGGCHHENYQHLSGLSVWALGLKDRAWKLVSKVHLAELVGPGCAPEMNSDLKLQLVGDLLIFSCWYKHSTFGSFPLVSFDLGRCKWVFCSTAPASSDLEACYAFVPSLTATA